MVRTYLRADAPLRILPRFPFPGSPATHFTREVAVPWQVVQRTTNRVRWVAMSQDDWMVLNVTAYLIDVGSFEPSLQRCVGDLSRVPVDAIR